MASPVDCQTLPVTEGAELIEEIDCSISDDDDSEEYSTDSDEYGGPFVDMNTTCPGERFTKEQEEEIGRKWFKEYINLCGEYAKMCNELMDSEDSDEDADEDANSSLSAVPLKVDVNSSIPPAPLKVLPETTSSCIKKGYCYHREYMTDETDETSQTLGYDEPHDMLQVLSLRLSCTKSCPISVYGIFAIRDDLEPLRNYVFNRTRDDPVVIEKSVEAAIQVSALVDNPSHVRFIAFSRCFDDIILSNGKGIMKGELTRHVIAVKAEEQLGVRLELDDLVFEWTFQDGARVSSPSDDLIINQFQVTGLNYSEEDLRVVGRPAVGGGEAVRRSGACAAAAVGRRWAGGCGVCGGGGGSSAPVVAGLAAAAASTGSHPGRHAGAAVMALREDPTLSRQGGWGGGGEGRQEGDGTRGKAEKSCMRKPQLGLLKSDTKSESATPIAS
ncbi:hypothetical protein PR202_gb00596 [Eleusine coracana subsp. coracana]|uniref:DUF6598 domain-containing protein n=1 Tax=Eleusine coracana subsp. coracana TaxID=191504 RepID=A0AAV5DTI2_ELECO|nr:hypothetical protein PR202_gb00596 [Eleusine coracana subsp. coracana]